MTMGRLFWLMYGPRDTKYKSAFTVTASLWESLRHLLIYSSGHVVFDWVMERNLDH
jgi:hypothetical protein